MDEVMRPVAGRVKTTGLFGDRREGYVHRGLDFHVGGQSLGAPLYMPGGWEWVDGLADGTVGLEYVGHAVAVRDGQGYLWRWWHLAEPPEAPLGYQVKETPVGVMGSTGSSTGPHAHLEVTEPGWAMDGFRLRAGSRRIDPLMRYADLYARAVGISAPIFRAQIAAESAWNPRAVSPAGARGLCQIIPRWHPVMAGKCMDPFESLEYAARLMRKHLNRRLWDWREALADYNVGPHAVGEARIEGQAYADKILSVASAPVG